MRIAMEISIDFKGELAPSKMYISYIFDDEIDYQSTCQNFLSLLITGLFMPSTLDCILLGIRVESCLVLVAE